MNDKNVSRRTGLLAAVAAAGLILGILLAQWLPNNLLGLRGTTGGDSASVAAGDSGDQSQLWTCGMHPHVIQDEPGQCPICGMDLTPMKGGGSSLPSHAGHDLTEGPPQWTCPDHSMIVESEPGQCPIDGLDLLPSAPEGGEREILFYRNPMDPTITSPVPAKDSMGMDYVPVYSEGAGGSGKSGSGRGAVVEIDPAVVQNMNVRTQTAERRDLTRPIRTVGYLEFDQQRMVTVTTKYSGWVEKVHVNYVGEKVRRGQPLFEIYSPDLVQTEQELLSALDFARETGRRAGGCSQSGLVPGGIRPHASRLLGHYPGADHPVGRDRRGLSHSGGLGTGERPGHEANGRPRRHGRTAGHGAVPHCRPIEPLAVRRAF